MYENENVEPDTCEGRDYKCCELMPPDESPDAEWYDRHVENYQREQREELVSVLADDIGGTYGAPNTHKVGNVLYRATLVPDECSWSEDIGDNDEGMGRTAWADTRAEYPRRPDGFDGNAEILRVGRNDPVWWQPPVDVPRTSLHFAELRRNVSDLLEFGYSVITVERCEGEDAYHRPIVVGVASLGGIEPYADEAYLRMLVSDLVDEVTP